MNPTVNSKDVVFIQRSDDNEFYGEAHISGNLLIPYIDETGHINADTSASFYNKFPVSKKTQEVYFVGQSFTTMSFVNGIFAGVS